MSARPKPFVFDKHLVQMMDFIGSPVAFWQSCAKFPPKTKVLEGLVSLGADKAYFLTEIQTSAQQELKEIFGDLAKATSRQYQKQDGGIVTLPKETFYDFYNELTISRSKIDSFRKKYLPAEEHDNKPHKIHHKFFQGKQSVSAYICACLDMLIAKCVELADKEPDLRRRSCKTQPTR